MKKAILNSYFTIHPNWLGTGGVILTIMAALFVTSQPFVLFALLLLPLLQSQQVVPEVEYEEEDDEYGGGKLGFVKE